MSPGVSTDSESAHRRPPLAQRGDMLLEALIAMFLLTIVGMGPAYVASRTAVAQKHMNVQNSAVTQMRNMLLAQGNTLCGSAPTISVAGQALAVTVTCTPRTGVQIGGNSLSLSAATIVASISLSVTSASLFGGAGTIIVGE